MADKGMAEGKNDVALIAPLTFAFWAGVAAIFGGFGHALPALVCVVLSLIFTAVAVMLNGAGSSAWLNALIGQDGPPSLYDWTLDRSLPRIRKWLYVPEPAADAGLVELLRGAFTYRLLDRALLFSVLYPIALLVGYWGLSGQAGMLGSVEIIPATTERWIGIAAVCGLACVFVAFTYQERATASPKSFLRRFSGWLCWAVFLLFAIVFDLPSIAVAGAVAFALAVALAVALAFALAFAFALAGAVAFAFALAGAFAIALAGALAGAGAVAFAFAFALALEYLGKSEKHRTRTALTLCYPPLMITLALIVLPWADLGTATPQATTLFLFLGVLPFINALFDTLSYGATLALIARGRRDSALWFGLVVGPVLALLLFLGLAGVLVCVAWAMEAVAGVPFVDLATLLTAPFDWSQYAWLYLMLFSTALPTVVHMLLALASFHKVVSLRLRQWAASWTETTRADERSVQFAAVLIIGGYISLILGATMSIAWGIAMLVWHWGLEAFLYAYRDLLVSLFVSLPS